MGRADVGVIDLLGKPERVERLTCKELSRIEMGNHQSLRIAAEGVLQQMGQLEIQKIKKKMNFWSEIKNLFRNGNFCKKRNFIIAIFGKDRNFWQKSKFLSKTETLTKHRNFCQQNRDSKQKSECCLKTAIFVKNGPKRSHFLLLFLPLSCDTGYVCFCCRVQR